MQKENRIVVVAAVPQEQRDHGRDDATCANNRGEGGKRSYRPSAQRYSIVTSLRDNSGIAYDFGRPSARSAMKLRIICGDTGAMRAISTSRR